MSYKKKLIEVALPLEAINKASAREKSIRHGHPSTLHLWWARRPLATARAVIFAQMVDDPSAYVDELLSVTETRRAAEIEFRERRALWQQRKAEFEAATGHEEVAVPEPGPEPALEDCATDIERQRLFRIIEELVLWENTTNETVLQKARTEIWKSWKRTCEDHRDHPLAAELFNPEKLPAFHDPFAGGGALPLEAQRLGLEAYASDLNPVAVLINKAMIEIPPKFAGRPPVNPKGRKNDHGLNIWKGAQGLAEDVRYYGQWMRDEAERRIGHLYPKIAITAEMIKERPDLKKYLGRELTIIAWLWARTVKSPNPAVASVDVPLVSTFMLSTKTGKEAYVEPVIENGGYRFTVKVGKPKDEAVAKAGTKLSRGAFKCIMSDSPFKYSYIDDEANAGRMGSRLMAIVAEGDRGRVYLSPTSEHEATASMAKPTWKPDAPSRGTWASNAQGRRYGFRTFGDYFTPRQLVALTTFSDLVSEAMERIRLDATAADLPGDGKTLRDGGTGPVSYAEAIGVYLSCGISRLANRLATICVWNKIGEKIEQVFARQAIPMTWDFPEANAFSDSTGGWSGSLEWVPKVLEKFPLKGTGCVDQANAAMQSTSLNKIVSTDPPYYDNIGYADLSDFFFVWLRRSLKKVFPTVFATLTVPKDEELVATPYRHGSKEKAEEFFLNGMTQAMHRIAEHAHPEFPVTIYYAFKQSEKDGSDGNASTGWETFLGAVVRAGFTTSGTWPMRTERDYGVKSGLNVLASSIIIVCRQRTADVVTATRREFLAALKQELPLALKLMQAGNIAPVDLAQAAIGPGMAVFTRYAKVLDAQGNPMAVREALSLINQTLDEVLAEQEGDFDSDTRWAVSWFEQTGFSEGDFGDANTLANAKNTSVAGLVQAGILISKAGKVRLFKPSELPTNWDPDKEKRLTIWEMVHHMIRSLESAGEQGAAQVLAMLGARAEPARELAYRLYTICERKKRAADALSYNGLIQSWPEIARLANEQKRTVPTQTEMFT